MKKKYILGYQDIDCNYCDLGFKENEFAKFIESIT